MNKNQWLQLVNKNRKSKEMLTPFSRLDVCKELRAIKDRISNVNIYTVKTDVLWWHKECAVVAQLCYILSKIGQNIAQMCYHSTSFLTGYSCNVIMC